MIQDEQGRLKTADGQFEARRRYVWTETEGWLQIHFEDMRPFVAFPKQVPQPQATHLCDPDRYEVTFDFALWPNWETVWTVKGPRKSYVMRSLFEPLA